MAQLEQEQHPPLFFFFIGDSVTYGYGISSWPHNNYPAKLQEMLGKDYIENNYGVSGCTVQKDSNKPYMDRKEYRDSTLFDPDIVVFMMGSNDSKPFNWKGPEKFREGYIALIDNYKNSSLILCTVATAFQKNGKDGGETSFHIVSETVDEIAAIIREVAREKGLPLLDINSITSSHPEWFSSDRVHSNREGAEKIAQLVHEMILSLR